MNVPLDCLGHRGRRDCNVQQRLQDGGAHRCDELQLQGLVHGQRVHGGGVDDEAGVRIYQTFDHGLEKRQLSFFVGAVNSNGLLKHFQQLGLDVTFVRPIFEPNLQLGLGFDKLAGGLVNEPDVQGLVEADVVCGVGLPDALNVKNRFLCHSGQVPLFDGLLNRHGFLGGRVHELAGVLHGHNAVDHGLG